MITGFNKPMVQNSDFKYKSKFTLLIQIILNLLLQLTLETVSNDGLWIIDKL